MTHSFKAGDVVLYSGDKGVAIVERREDAYLRLQAWKAVCGEHWTVELEGHLPLVDCKLHPDPDAVLADYTLWMLTHA
jgi:hypothetical protein